MNAQKRGSLGGGEVVVTVVVEVACGRGNEDGSGSGKDDGIGGRDGCGNRGNSQ